MLVCVFLSALARETAGAARTRSSLRPLLRVACVPLGIAPRPLFREGGLFLSKPGRIAPRDRETAFEIRMTSLRDLLQPSIAGSVNQTSARRLFQCRGQRAIFRAVGAGDRGDLVQVILGLFAIALFKLPQ